MEVLMKHFKQVILMLFLIPIMSVTADERDLSITDCGQYNKTRGGGISSQRVYLYVLLFLLLYLKLLAIYLAIFR